MVRPFQPLRTEGQPGGSAILDRNMQAVKTCLDSVQPGIDERAPSGNNVTGKPLLSGKPNSFGTVATPSDSAEGVSVDLVPSTQASGRVATGGGRNDFVVLIPGRQYTITATCTCWNSSGAVAFTSTTLVRAYCTVAGVATIMGSPAVLHSSGSGVTFTMPVSGNAILLETLNSSGSTLNVQVTASVTSCLARQA